MLSEKFLWFLYYSGIVFKEKLIIGKVLVLVLVLI